MNKESGFTLIELVAVLVILSLLGAMAVPRFASVQDDALRAALDGSSNAVKSAHSIAIANFKRLPTLTELVAEISGGAAAAVSANADGVQITVGSNNYLVPTFTDSTCSSATSAGSPTVACVGTASSTPLP